MPPTAERFTNALLGRGLALNLDSTKSLAAGRVLLQAAVFVTVARFMKGLFTGDCTRVVAGIGWRNRAFENAGWR
jgi:hypothetical protein